MSNLTVSSLRQSGWRPFAFGVLYPVNSPSRPSWRWVYKSRRFEFKKTFEFCFLVHRNLCVQCVRLQASWNHYSDVIMSTTAFQITGVSVVCSTVCSGADQRKHQLSASLAFVRGSTSDRCISLTKQKTFLSIWWRHHDSLVREAA